MLCKHTHKVWVIDKERILENWDMLYAKTPILNKIRLKFWYGGIKQVYVNKEFEGRDWVFYDRPPSCASSKQAWKHWLWKMGFFKEYTVPCGKCEICRVEKSKEWSTKAWCEQQMWKNSCFITLTYDNEHIPEDRKLRRSDIQKFWKDLRYHLYKQTKKAKKVDLTEEYLNLETIYENFEMQFNMESGKLPKRRNKQPIRYLNCGEYGPATKRPHYHAQIWNFIPTDLRKWKKDKRGYWLYNSKKLSQIWGKGYVVIEEANEKTAGYVARYCTKKYKRTEEEQKRMKEKHQQEFIGASSLGFIGHGYWWKYKDMIKRNQGIIMKQNDHTLLRKLPKIMQKQWEEEDPETYEEYDYWKCKIGQDNWKKILEKTSLSEEEYINETYRQRQRKYELLLRNKGDLQGYL